MHTRDRFSGDFGPTRGFIEYSRGHAAPVIRSQSRAAIMDELQRQNGTGRKGFPHLPMEGAPRPGDMWRTSGR